MRKITIHLGGPAVIAKQLMQISGLVVDAVGKGLALDITISERKRSDEANARLHAMLTWLSKNHTWAGQQLPVTAWKRLCVAAFLRAQGEPVEMYPALDGHGIDIVFERTSEMSGKQVAELCTWIVSWADMQGLNMPEVSIDPATGRKVLTYARPPEVSQ